MTFGKPCPACKEPVIGHGIAGSNHPGGLYHELCWPPYANEPRATCPECNKQFLPEHESIRTNPNLCFSCDFWINRIERAAEYPNCSIRVDGHAYWLASESSFATDPPRFRGFGGRKFTIQRLNADGTDSIEPGRVITTTNLWYNGEIPAHFRDRLPNNAKFL